MLFCCLFRYMAIFFYKNHKYTLIILYWDYLVGSIRVPQSFFWCNTIIWVASFL